MLQTMRQKILKDDASRETFHQLLEYLKQATDPEKCYIPEDDAAFDEQFGALVSLYSALSNSPDYTRIVMWSFRGSECYIKGMDSWPLYWLTLGNEDCGVIELSIWADGHDDNRIQKGIKAWANTHFPGWEVEKLQCVRR